MAPGAPLDDAPVRLDGHEGRGGWLLRQIDSFTLLVFGPGGLTPQDLAALPVPVRLLRVQPAGQAGAGELEDVQGMIAKRLDAQPGTAYLLRPDQHVAARWRRVDAAAVRQALEELRRRNLLGYSEKTGFKIQSNAGEEWERERASHTSRVSL
jgi:3-(3-hydroxy-phenyl)propionate hydroxylase